MEEPTPTRQETLGSAFKTFIITKETINDVAMVSIITGRLCPPTFAIVPRFKEKPRIMTAHCKIFLDVNLTPSFSCSLFTSPSLIKVIIIPIKMENTGAPMTSKEKPPTDRVAKKVATPAIIAHNKIPIPFDLTNFIFIISSYLS